MASLLAELAPDGINPSIQSAPLGFKPKVTGEHVVEEYTTNVIDVVAHLVGLTKKTGKIVTLGLEPEPRCYLETTDETITYFKNHLFSGRTAQRLAKLTGLNEADAAKAMRDYTGVVFDIGHQAVGYEDIPASLQKLVDNGVQIVKLQEAASMHIPNVTQKVVDALQTFAKTIYLSQTCQMKDGKTTWFLNLEDAFEAFQKDPGPREWRTHFHVPVFLTDLGGGFGTTRFALEQALAFHKKTPLSTHLEIETYTWDVLPDHLKTGDIVEYVTREIEWVKAQLTQKVKGQGVKRQGSQVREQKGMNRERVTVLVAREGRHLFERIRDPRITIVSAADGLQPPDSVVLPCGQDRRFEQLSTTTLPGTLLASVASGGNWRRARRIARGDTPQARYQQQPPRRHSDTGSPSASVCVRHGQLALPS